MMNKIPLFSGEVSLYSDTDEGLRVECSEKHSENIKQKLIPAGFECFPDEVKISGTSDIHNLVEFGVSGGAFDVMKEIVYNYLIAEKLSITEEVFSVADDLHVRLNLVDVSVFDK